MHQQLSFLDGYSAVTSGSEGSEGLPSKEAVSTLRLCEAAPMRTFQKLSRISAGSGLGPLVFLIA